MQAGDLERYLHEHIPISVSMGVRVKEVSADRVILGAPLGPNINHRETVFGGSLSAWSSLHIQLAELPFRTRLVIQKNEMRYEAPVNGDFQAAACTLAPEKWERMLRTLNRMGRARANLKATLYDVARTVAHFEGSFVVMRMKD